MRTVLYSSITLRKEEPSTVNITWRYLSVWRKKLRENYPKWRGKSALYQDNAPCHKSIATMAKLHESHFELLPHPPYSPDLAPSNYYLFADLKECSMERDLASMPRWSPKLKGILRPKVNRSIYKKGIEMLDKRWNESLLKETMLMNKVEFYLKGVFLVILRTYWVVCYIGWSKKIRLFSKKSVPPSSKVLRK